jgi:hypothetical protein
MADKGFREAGRRLKAAMISYQMGYKGVDSSLRQVPEDPGDSLYKREFAAALPNDELRSRIANFQIEHKASTPFDDDEYWMARSPF